MDTEHRKNRKKAGEYLGEGFFRVMPIKQQFPDVYVGDYAAREHPLYKFYAKCWWNGFHFAMWSSWQNEV